MINIGNDILIKDIAGNGKLSLGVSESFVHTKELMKENSITIEFNLNVMFDFVRGDSVEHEGEKFILRKNYQPEEVDSGQYRYELVFEGVDMQFQDFIMFYTMQGLKEAEWTLTSSARNFMVIALENIRRYFNDDSFVLGDVIDSDIQNISFDADTVFDALATIAETFECDWYLAEKTLSLVSKYEYGDPVLLEREVTVSDITRSNDNNDAEYCTRLYALGSTRNIPKNYRTTGSSEAVDTIVQKRLRLPISNGDYIDAIPSMKQSEILERVVRFDEIYPRRVGTITELRSVDRAENENNPFIVYFFKDSGLEFKLDYILPGETLMMTFESGWLQGRDFELAYNGKTGEFEIINDTSNSDLTIPNEVLKPRVGDEYVIYNFNISLVSDKYIQEAEAELLEEATKWLKGITEDNATYECPNVPGYCYQNGIDLDIGQRVQMVSPIFMDGNKISRIYGYTKNLFNKYICTYLVGDASKYSRLANIEKNVSKTQKQTDVMYKEISKGIRALNYIRTAIENDTVVDKGMILTTLLRMGATSGNEWKEHAGISGIYEEPNDVAFWAGGTFDDSINNLANIILRMNGSGHLAKGNILWDTFGNLLLSGKFESNKNDKNKIIIDPETRSLKLIYEDIIVFELDYFINNTFVGSRMKFNLYNINTRELVSQTELDYEGIDIKRKTSTGLATFFKASSSNKKIWIDAKELPQSKDKAYPREVYMDGETLKVYIDVEK